MNFGVNAALFALFFAIALAEAVQEQDWLMAGLFFAIGIVFLNTDKRKWFKK